MSLEAVCECEQWTLVYHATHAGAVRTTSVYQWWCYETYLVLDGRFGQNYAFLL